MLRSTLLGSALLLAWSSSTLFAAESDDLFELSLDQLLDVQVVVASRLGASVRNSPGSVSVITRADIRAMGARSLNEVLQTVPGMEVGIAPKDVPSTQYRIRGLISDGNPHTLFLLNGTVMPNLDNGGRPLQFRMPLAMVERVEVVRGPGSAAFGADAFAGVVNIVTRDPASLPTGWLDLGAGSFQQRDLAAGMASPLGPGHFSLSFETQHSDGDRDRRVDTDQQTNLDAFLGSNASLAPGAIDAAYRLSQTLMQWQHESVRTALWLWQGDFGLGAGPVQALNLDSSDEMRAGLLDVDWKLPFSQGDWEHRLRWVHRDWQQRPQYEPLPDGVILPIGADGNVNAGSPVGLVLFSQGLRDHQHLQLRSDMLEFESRWTGERHRVRLSGGGQAQRFELRRNARNYGPGAIDGSQGVVDGALVDVTGTANAALPDVSRELWFVSLEDEFRLDPAWTLNAGIRHDRYSDFGGTSNPRLALLWSPSDSWMIKLLGGRAFRAPTTNELYARNRGTFRGNPLLQPETNQTLELNALYSPTPQWSWQASLYRYRARDVIARVFDPETSISSLANSAGIDGEGGELAVAWQGERLSVRGSYSLALPRASADGAPLAHVAQRHAYVDARWNLDQRWSLRLGVDRVMDRERPTGDERAAVADYTWLDLSLVAVDLRPGLDARLLLSNLGDTDARASSVANLADDLPLDGRSAWIGLSWHWQ